MLDNKEYPANRLFVELEGETVVNVAKARNEARMDRISKDDARNLCGHYIQRLREFVEVEMKEANYDPLVNAALGSAFNFMTASLMVLVDQRIATNQETEKISLAGLKGMQDEIKRQNEKRSR